MTTETREAGAGLIGLAHRVITGWALFGGFVIVGVVLINAYSILSGAIINKPFSGDFELTEMGAAIGAFAFLPYCQLVGANVSADIFTMKAGPRSVAFMSTFSSIIAVAFGAIMIWRMYAGLQDYREYTEVTGILGIPLWYAFVPALISLVLLLLASLITLSDALKSIRNNGAA